MMTWGFWNSDLWRSYCRAYGDGSYTDNQSLRGNLVIPISRDPDEMYGKLSKGHRADVKFATAAYIEQWGVFADYERLHKEAHGSPRPQTTYDIQRAMCESGIAFVISAYASMLDGGGQIVPGHLVAAALFFVMDEGSYYASAARCREHIHRGAAHLLVWRAMLHLGARGVLWMDCGPIPAPDADEKAVNVARFKAHFGASVPASSGPVVMNGND